MANVIVINGSTEENRVAVLGEGGIQDFFLERRRDRGVVGNIYKGRVLRVLPGMQAAFVDIGLEKAAFLYVNDVYQDHAKLEMPDEDEEAGKASGRRKKKNIPPIEDQLKQGQEILVQVTKEPIDTKGARATCHISMPGRHLVFMPTVEHLGISRQISSEKERRRLRGIANEMRPKGGGFIVRTAADGVPSKVLKRDMKLLIDSWNDIYDRAKKSKAPKLLYEDLDLALRCTRDLAMADLDRLIVDTREDYDRILDFIERVMPRLASKVELYVGSEPIFDAFGIENELRTAASRRADLPSGGYLIIEKTEALTSVDVNTGRFVGNKNLEETIVKTNLEAAKELAYQLRLRGIGGLIIVDFIDMEESKNRQKVERALQAALAGDKGRVKTARISEFGILEMTRKRTGESFLHQLTEECETCGGTGRVKSRETIAFDVLRDLRRNLPTIPEFDVRVLAHPRVIALLTGRERETIKELELRFNKKISLRSDRSMHVEAFDIIGFEKRPTPQPLKDTTKDAKAKDAKAKDAKAKSAKAKSAKEKGTEATPAADPKTGEAVDAEAPKAKRGKAKSGGASKAKEASSGASKSRSRSRKPKASEPEKTDAESPTEGDA